MSSVADRQKAAIIAETRKRETDEAERLFREGWSRTRIARHLGIPPSTVSDRLRARGHGKGMAPPTWSGDEQAIIAEAARDPAMHAGAIAHRLPGRSCPAINEKLRAARLAGGHAPGRRSAPLVEEARSSMPEWDLPPGAYRDWRGITLKLIPCLTEDRT